MASQYNPNRTIQPYRMLTKTAKQDNNHNSMLINSDYIPIVFLQVISLTHLSTSCRKPLTERRENQFFWSLTVIKAHLNSKQPKIERENICVCV